MAASNIEWTDATWNCLAGCEAISAGCAHCYAATMTRRLEAMGQADYAGLVDLRKRHFNGIVRCLPEKLSIPLKWKKPKRIFVNSMSDLFHEDVPDEFIDKVFSVMALAPKHTYQILTKRSERMAAYMNNPEAPNRVSKWAFGFAMENHGYDNLHFFNWPMPQVWLGVSAEDQQRADERIPWLLKTPAAVRFVSAEPLISSLDLSQYLHDRTRKSVSSSGGPGLVHREAGRSDLEEHQVPRGRCIAPHSDQATPGGDEQVSEGRLSSGHVSRCDDSQEGVSQQNFMDDREQERHSAVDGREPQGRRKAKQSPGQPGVEHQGSKRRSLVPRAGTEDQGSARRKEFIREGDGAASGGDSGTGEASRIATERDRAALRDHPSHGLGNRLQEVLGVGLDWVIAGGESGGGSRPCNVGWVRSIIEQCRAVGVACFVKQLGSHPIEGGDFALKTGPVTGLKLRHKKGGDAAEWSQDLQVREYPREVARA